jgi:membrane protease YdiL (CAAX protease family)
MLKLKSSPILRVVLFWASYLAILWLAAIPKGLVPAPWDDLVWGLVAVPLVWLVSRWMSSHTADEPRGPRTAHGRWPGFFIGLGVGAATYAATVWAVSLVATPITLIPATLPTTRAMAIAVLTVLALAYMEELGFRGYPLRTLTRAFGTERAQIIVAFAFAAMHLVFGWSWQMTVFGVLPSALLFGAAAARSGGLAMPTGVHAALNLARLMTGERGTVAIWTIQIDPARTGRVEAMAPWIGLAVTVFATAALWSWRGSKPTGDASARS